MIYLHARGLYHVLLLICNRELLFIGKRKDEGTARMMNSNTKDAVLLEQDSFANPEDSVIDVESGELAETAAKIADEAIAAENSADNADGGSAVDAK